VTWRIGGGLPASAAPVAPGSVLRWLRGSLVVGLGYYGLAALGGIVQLTRQTQVDWLLVGFDAAFLYLGDLQRAREGKTR
jgi:hypothetical protein